MYLNAAQGRVRNCRYRYKFSYIALFTYHRLQYKKIFIVRLF